MNPSILVVIYLHNIPVLDIQKCLKHNGNIRMSPTPNKRKKQYYLTIEGIDAVIKVLFLIVVIDAEITLCAIHLIKKQKNYKLSIM